MDPSQITDELKEIFSCCPDVDGRVRASDFIQATSSKFNVNTDELSALLRDRLDPQGTDPSRTKEELHNIFLDWISSTSAYSPPITESGFNEGLGRGMCSTPAREMRGPHLLLASRYRLLNRESSSSPDVSREARSDSSPNFRLMACHEKRRLEEQLKQTEIMVTSLEERITNVTTETDQLKMENKMLSHKMSNYMELESLLEEAADQQRKLETEINEVKESLRAERSQSNTWKQRNEDLETRLVERESELAEWIERYKVKEEAAVRVVELQAEVQHWREGYSALRRQSDLAFTEYTSQIRRMELEREQRLESISQDELDVNMSYEMRSPSIMEEIAAVQHSANLTTTFDLGKCIQEADSCTQTDKLQKIESCTQTDMELPMEVEVTRTIKSEVGSEVLKRSHSPTLKILSYALILLLMIFLFLVMSSSSFIKVRYTSPPPV